MVARLMWAFVRGIRTRWGTLVGLLALFLASWVAMYGRLWAFEAFEEHRFTARAMLTGTLRLTGALSRVNGDEQIYGGAGYTNWGFGVPLLQVPFHAAAGALGVLHGFFPDRAVYFTYLAASVPVLWAALDRLLAMRPGPEISRLERGTLAWAATWLVLARTLYPLMSTRFIVYESTLAYAVIAQLLALSAYIFLLRSNGSRAALALGAAAGMGLLIRPTGLLYAGVWGGTVVLEPRTRRRVWAFATGFLPPTAFWLWSNKVRTGSVFGLGFANTNPSFAYHTPMERFGSQCCDTASHTVAAATRLFSGFFLFAAKRSIVPWLNDCHFDWEERDLFFPFFGPIFLLLLAWMLYRLVRRRERRPALYLPYLAMALLFASFVHRGQGFAWRYAHDFWPAIVLAVVQYVHTRPEVATRRTDVRAGTAMLAYGLFVFLWFLVPWQWSKRPEIIPVSDAAAMEARFLADRWAMPDTIGSEVRCGDRLPPLYHDGFGWGQSGCTSPEGVPLLVRARPPFIGCDLPPCAVGTFTNVYIGVPAKVGDDYRLVLHTEGMSAPSLPIYVNGEFTSALPSGDHYEAPVRISYGALQTRAVMVTVEWTRTFVAPAAKLLSIELI
jgi:hypothetical protein